MLNQRTSGILLHPTSLPGPHGCGDFGPNAYYFVDWLSGAGQRTWQVLPLMPVGPGDSPYYSVSAFAGNPLLVALEPLIERGWLASIEPAELTGFSAHSTEYCKVIPWRMEKLRQAYEGFKARASAQEQTAFADWVRAQGDWLRDYALFMAIDTHVQSHSGYKPWNEWEPDLAQRKPAALKKVAQTHADEIAFWQFIQWNFDTQWQSLRAYAKEKGIAIIGDLPIFVAHHSADVWARPDLFELDKTGAQQVVAGVPPDFFSPTGQRWGNPLYKWRAHEKEHFAWWITRLRRQFELADIVRIDHFRGFAAYWEVPGTCPTAEEGRWVPAPGEKLFKAIEKAMGPVPIIAEDLGVITPDVDALRNQFKFPGMRIVQFGFSGEADHEFLPHNFSANTVAYTGTHDNDTARGWFATATARERSYAQSYLNVGEADIHWGMIRATLASVANTVIFPLQDVLGLDGYHRMNTPGQASGAWAWRFNWDWVGSHPGGHLAYLCALYGRAPMARLNLPDYPADKPQP